MQLSFSRRSPVNIALRMMVLGVLSGTALLAQDLTGTWQGILQAGDPPKDLRILVKITKPDDAGLKAVIYSLDQGGQPLAGVVTLQGSTMKIAIPGIGGSYEGKLDAGAGSMTGTWTQGAGPQPLILKHVTTDAAWAISDVAARPKPMAADANPVFEVATIKLSRPDTQGKGIRVVGRRFTTTNTSLSDLITLAYGLHPHQIAGAPSWVESDRYDLAAEFEADGQPSDAQWKKALQKLIADRFKLTVHRDRKELSVYAIVVGKTGPKLTKSEGDPNGLPTTLLRGLGVLTVRNATIADLAGLMQAAILDRPVVDQTGLTGRFDFTLTWTPDEFQFGGLGIKAPPATNNDAAPDLFTAIQEQLGLRLESTKAQADILVVDHVEKPSEN
jgi:uncharacterized protein (TIGR03435 family)